MIRIFASTQLLMGFLLLDGCSAPPMKSDADTDVVGDARIDTGIDTMARCMVGTSSSDVSLPHPLSVTLVQRWALDSGPYGRGVRQVLAADGTVTSTDFAQTLTPTVTRVPGGAAAAAALAAEIESSGVLCVMQGNWRDASLLDADDYEVTIDRDGLSYTFSFTAFSPFPPAVAMLFGEIRNYAWSAR